MEVLTPSGYVHPVNLSNGASLCAFDEASNSIINVVENIDSVDYNRWCLWHVAGDIPPFNWYRINGRYLLFREQSVWRNGTNVCHARDLIVGDILHDDCDNDLIITSIDEIEDKLLQWYRFDVSGDHSYILNGLMVHNASRFWVLGTGTWDNATTTHWAATSGAGAGGSSVPGSSDTVTFDGASGGGTVTLNFGGTITIQSLTMGAFTGTWDNSANNNNITVSTTSAISISGTATRTINLGSATYTLPSGATWAASTTTGLTFSGGSSTITFSANSSNANFQGGGLTYGTVNIGAISGAGRILLTGANTFGHLNVSAPNAVQMNSGTTQTVSNTFSWAGSSGSEILICGSNFGSSATVATTAGSTMSWAAFRDMTFTNTPVASNSFDLGNNSTITITPPIAAGSGSGVIGS